MPLRRRRSKQSQTLKERLSDRAVVLREQAQTVVYEDARRDLLKRALACDVAAELDGWLSSRELTAPT